MTSDKITKTDPVVALTIFQGAVENLEAAGVDFKIGLNNAGDAVIVFAPGVHLCPGCGKFSAGASCQFLKCKYHKIELPDHPRSSCQDAADTIAAVDAGRSDNWGRP